MDSSGCEVAQLRTRFRRAEKTVAAELALRWTDRARKRRDQIMNELLEVGATVNAGFFAPAGLDLGAETPEEIAFSVVSEIQRIFGGGSGEFLRERKLPVHAVLERANTSALLKR
jgi:XdhC Rossmann domain